jgi:hypothetical protein
LGIYIHYLKDQFGKTSTKGADPFDDLALIISNDGKSASVKVWKNQKWKSFDDYPTVDLNWKQEFAGKLFRFSQLRIKLYDWVADNGYTNFDNWIENSVKDKENGKY